MGVVGGRWVWTSLLATFAESADFRGDTLTDLRTGKKVTATVWDEDASAQAFALPGALVVGGEGGITARFTDGRKQVLESANADALAVSGARIYWRVDGCGPQRRAGVAGRRRSGAGRRGRARSAAAGPRRARGC